MKYDPFFDCFKVIVGMTVGAQFKFIVHGSYEASFDYPIIYVNVSRKFLLGCTRLSKQYI